MRRRSAIAGSCILGLASLLPGTSVGVASDLSDSLVWHVQAATGEELDSRLADRAVNPASVIKIATTAWALERLGPDHRFSTGFGVRGSLDLDQGVLDGDLLVVGDSDPDFHVENAYLVALALNRAGLREVTGKLLVDDHFWLGWEGGSARRDRDPAGRSTSMAVRLCNALDPDRWSRSTRRSIEEFEARRGLVAADRPRVVIRGGTGRRNAESRPDRLLVVHRSNPLSRALKRLNAYSNNDIERLEPALGSAAELQAYLERVRVAGEAAIRVETLSGLGSNRMTPRQIVRLLGRLRAICLRNRMTLADVLPVAGRDPGTLESFPRFEDVVAGALVAKTGSLTSTDGGVAALAGVLSTVRGELSFAVACPRAGTRLDRARRAQQDWLLDLTERHGGAQSGPCGARVTFSDTEAEAVPVSLQRPEDRQHD